MQRLPIVTFLVAGLAVVVSLFPSLASWLVFDRSAILRGEFWRLFTGNWVHFSPAHLGCDILGFGIAGWLIESKGYKNLGPLCLLAGLAIGLGLLILDPAVRIYGGLSGIATAAVFFLGLNGLEEGRLWRRFCAALLAIVSAKICFELVSGNSLFVNSGTEGLLVPCPLSHLIGAIVAVVLYFCTQLQKSCVSKLTFFE